MIDPDTVKEIKAEERAYELWEKDIKNRIHRMSNPERKQREWNKYFPAPIELSSNEVF